MAKHQASLFETEPDPWDLDAQEDRLVATVVLPTGPDRVYDYLVPDEMRGQFTIGRRVQVSFGRGNRFATGYCVRLENKPAGQRKLKPIHSLVDSRSLLSPSMVQLTEWMAGYYLAPWGQVIEAVLPAGVRGQAGTRESTFLAAAPEAIERIQELKLPRRQAEVLQALAQAPAPMTLQELCTHVGCTSAPVQSLRKKGLIVAQTRRVAAAGPAERQVAREEHLDLEPDQQRALDAILNPLAASEHRTILVHGVTGSGKTEVYIQAIQEVLRHGRQAIVLVPEISLTPQTEQRFRSRFGQVAVLHSHMTDADRHHHWQRISRRRSASGRRGPQCGLCADAAAGAHHPRRRARVVIQARRITPVSCPRCGLAACAGRRAFRWCLGSATPSLESWHRAQAGEYQLVSLPRRVFDRPLPDVATIDLRLEFKDRRKRGAISRQLQLAMNEALADAGQVILLLNRRGYSTHIQCPACGHAMRCPNCTIALTHHRHRRQGRVPLLRLSSRRLRTACPECKFRRDSLRRAGDAKAGGRSASPLSAVSLPADGHRHDAQAGQPRTALDVLSRRRGADSAWGRR